MAEYRLSLKAREDMEAIWLFSLDRWGTSRAERCIDDLTNAFTYLTERPEAGMSCDHIRERYRRHSVVRHVVYYRKTLFGIEVMRILHDRMLASRHF